MCSPALSDDPPEFEFSELLADAARGDVGASDALFRRFYPDVQAMVHQRLAFDLRRHRPWLAARFSTGDVVQEVFRSVLASIGSFEGDSEDAFKGYLAMVVRNRIVDSIRFHEAEQRDGRQGIASDHLAEASTRERDPVDQALCRDEVRRFLEVLGEFDEREQLLLRARFEGAESFASLAERLGYSSHFAARRAFFAAQGRLVARLRAGRREQTRD